MQSKRILSLFLLFALLLLSACARQNPDPIVSTSSSCRAETSSSPRPQPIEGPAVRLSGDPVDRAEILPEGKTYRLIAADGEAFYPFDFARRAPDNRPTCLPQFSQNGEPTFPDVFVTAEEQKPIYEQALTRLGGQSDLPELLASFGEELEIILLDEGGVFLRPKISWGCLSVIVCASPEQAPVEIADWLKTVEPDPSVIYFGPGGAQSEGGPEGPQGKSFVFLRVEQRGQELVLTQFRSDFVPNEAEEAKAFEDAFRAFAQYLPKI